MYLPETFREADRDVLFELVETYSFATLISLGARPEISHVPLILDRSDPGRERLFGHVARANEHWKAMEAGEPVLAIFQGPNAYVSPAWYAEHPSVPTWSYAVVHAYGRPRLVDEDGTWSILQRLLAKHEGQREEPWQPELPSAFVKEELAYIVGFEVAVESWEGKFKLGQNKSAEDRRGAIEGLAREANPRSRELAEFAGRYFARRRR